jgi:hypothetical protein
MTGPSSTTAVVVYESMFGNTAEVAEAVCRGLALEGVDARCVAVGEMTTGRALDEHLLVVGAPTHAFSLSRPESRRTAVERGAPDGRARIGVREWLEQLGPARGAQLAAAFDTRDHRVRRLPWSAARTAARLLRRRGFLAADRPHGFVVADLKGPVVPGDLERAVEWGRLLGRRTQDWLASGEAETSARRP